MLRGNKLNNNNKQEYKLMSVWKATCGMRAPTMSYESLNVFY